MSINRHKKTKSTKALTQYSKNGTKNNSETEDFFQKITDGPLNFGRALAAIRLSEEVSQAEFARALGLSRQHLNDIEKGRRSVSVEKAAKYAQILGQPASVFVRLALQSIVEEAGFDFKVEIAS